jgi:hypothetical protein
MDNEIACVNRPLIAEKVTKRYCKKYKRYLREKERKKDINLEQKILLLNETVWYKIKIKNFKP